MTNILSLPHKECISLIPIYLSYTKQLRTKVIFLIAFYNVVIYNRLYSHFSECIVVVTFFHESARILDNQHTYVVSAPQMFGLKKELTSQSSMWHKDFQYVVWRVWYTYPLSENIQICCLLWRMEPIIEVLIFWRKSELTIACSVSLQWEERFKPTQTI